MYLFLRMLPRASKLGSALKRSLRLALSSAGSEDFQDPVLVILDFSAITERISNDNKKEFRVIDKA